MSFLGSNSLQIFACALYVLLIKTSCVEVSSNHPQLHQVKQGCSFSGWLSFSVKLCDSLAQHWAFALTVHKLLWKERLFADYTNQTWTQCITDLLGDLPGKRRLRLGDQESGDSVDPGLELVCSKDSDARVICREMAMTPAYLEKV